MTNIRQSQAVTNAATTLVSLLGYLGYSCALCGELACYGFGISRVPKKVEALVLTPAKRPYWPSIEDIKFQLVQHSSGPSRFFTSWDKNDNSNILFYHDHTASGDLKTFPVEISYLETSATHVIRHVNGLPFVPITYVILQKLERWAEPLASSSTHARRAAEDVILTLLNIVQNVLDDLDTEPLYPPLYIASRDRIQRFISEYPGSSSTWAKIDCGSNILPKPAVVDSPESVSSPTSQSSTIFHTPEIFDCVEEPEPPPIVNPTRTQMVLMAAKESVRLLHKCGWRSAIFGSVACFLYGNTRAPNDVDLLIVQPSESSTVTAEELKQNLVVLDPYHFFSTPAKDPQASYRLLYYRLTDNPTQLTAKTSCKIDIVLPGVMNLPNLPPSLIHWDEGLPLIPFCLLLLQKLQAWDDHRQSKIAIKWQRQRTDMEDLDALTSLSAFVPLTFSQPWSDEALFSPKFQVSSKKRVLDYCKAFPAFAPAWASLGFETSQ